MPRAGFVVPPGQADVEALVTEPDLHDAEGTPHRVGPVANLSHGVQEPLFVGHVVDLDVDVLGLMVTEEGVAHRAADDERTAASRGASPDDSARRRRQSDEPRVRRPRATLGRGERDIGLGVLHRRPLASVRHAGRTARLVAVHVPYWGGSIVLMPHGLNPRSDIKHDRLIRALWHPHHYPIIVPTLYRDGPHLSPALCCPRLSSGLPGTWPKTDQVNSHEHLS